MFIFDAEQRHIPQVYIDNLYSKSIADSVKNIALIEWNPNGNFYACFDIEEREEDLDKDKSPYTIYLKQRLTNYSITKSKQLQLFGSMKSAGI